MPPPSRIARPLSHIVFEMTGACNLHCKHCYVFQSDARRARPDLLTLDVIERLARSAVPLGLKQCTFTGGEIFARRDVLPVLRGCAHHIDQLILFSNLTLLTDEHVAALRDLPVRLISTSLDGLSETHDRFRGSPGAFARTLAALRRLRAVGIPVKVSVTVTPDSLEDAGKLFAMLDSEAIPTSIARVARVGRGTALALPSPGFDASYTRLLASRLSRAMPADTAASRRASPEPFTTYCGIGESMLYIQSDGLVGLCPILTPGADPQWLVGNALEHPLDEIWRSLTNTWTTPPSCCEISGCAHRSWCRGGCRANALLATGALDACDSELRHGFDAAIGATYLPRYKVT